MRKLLLIIIATIIANVGFSDEMPPEVKRLKEQRDRKVAEKTKEIDTIYHRVLERLKKKYAAQKNYSAAAYVEKMQIVLIDSEIKYTAQPVSKPKMQLRKLAVPVQTTDTENLITNGDFSKGSKGWKGEENIEFENEESTNKVCKLYAKRNKQEYFTQVVDTRGLKQITVKFRLKKSPDYEGGLGLMFIPENGGGAGYPMKNPGNNEWNVISRSFSNKRDSSKITLKFSARAGDSGYLMFDNIEVTGK